MIVAQNGGELTHADSEPKAYPSETRSGRLHEAYSKAQYTGPYETQAKETRSELPAQSEVQRQELYGEGRQE